MKLLQQNKASGSPKTRYFTHFHVLIRLPRSAHLIIMCTHPTSSTNMSKNVKNRKNPLYPLLLKNPLYPDCPKSWRYRLGVFRSVRDLRVHKRMRSSDATCCASMAVNTCFFSPRATTSKIWPPGVPKLGAELIFMSSLRRHPH